MEGKQNGSPESQQSQDQIKPFSIDFEVETKDQLVNNLPPEKKTITIRLEEENSSENKISQPLKQTLKNPLPQKEDVYSQTFNKTNQPKKAYEIKESLNKFPPPNIPTPAQKSNKKNNLLIVILVIILLANLSGGFFYFKYFKSEKNLATLAIIEKENSKPLNQPEQTEIPSPETKQIVIPFSSQEEEILLTNKTLQEELLSLKQVSIDNPVLTENLKNGIFYKIKKDDSALSAQELLQALNISLPIETTQTLKDGWLFVYLDQRSILKTGLVFAIDQESYTNVTFLNIEKDMPLIFKNLFIEEDSTTSRPEIVFQTNKEDNRLRFFNFVEEDTNRTIDWAKIDQFLFFTTSKETAFKLISLLEK